MPIAFVSGSDKTSSTSTLTAQAPVQGNVLVLWAANRTTSVTISSVSQTNVTWTFIGRRNSSAPSVEIWWGSVGASPGTSITITWSSGSNIVAEVAEFSGVSTSSPVDGSIAVNNGSSGTSPSTGSYSTTFNIELTVAVAAQSNQAVFAPSTSGGWVALAGIGAGTSPNNRAIAPAYLINSSSGSQSESWGSSSAAWSSLMIALEAPQTPVPQILAATSLHQKYPAFEPNCVAAY